MLSRFLFSPRIEIYHCKSRGGKNEEKRDRVDHRSRTVAYLQVKVHREGFLGTDEEDGGVEIFEGHKKSHRRPSDDGRSKVLQGNVPNNLEPVGPQVVSGLFEAAIELSQPRHDDQRHDGGDKRKLSQNDKPKTRPGDLQVYPHGVLQVQPHRIGEEEYRNSEDHSRYDDRGDHQKIHDVFEFEVLLLEEEGRKGPEYRRQTGDRQGHPEGDPQTSQVDLIVENSRLFGSPTKKPVEGKPSPG